MTSSIRDSKATVLILMATLTMVSYINRTAMPIAGSSIMKEFDLTQTQMGTIYSAFLFSYSILMAPGGALSDRFGPRIVLGLTGLASALVTALAALVGRPPLSTFAGAFASFQLIRLLVGAFSSPLFPGCARTTTNWFEVDQRARVAGVVIGGAPLGAAITPVVVAWLIAGYGWRSALCVTAVTTATASLVWMVVVRNTPANAAPAVKLKKEDGSWLQLLRNRDLLLLSAGYFALNYFEYIFFYWIYYYFGEVKHMPAQASAVYTTILLLTMMAATLFGGWLADAIGHRIGILRSRRTIASTGMVASALLLYLGVNANGDVLIVFLLAMALGCAAASEAPFWTSAADAGGKDAGAATGMMNGIGNAGGLIAPVLTPYLAERAGWSAGLYFASGVVLVGAAIWIFFRGQQRLPLAETA